MKRLSILLFVVFCGFGLVGFWMQITVVSEAAPSEIVCVKPGGGDGCFGTIQAGINASNFQDTVRVSHGIFTENIVISKFVKIEGGWNSDFSLRDINKFSTTIHSAVDDQSVVTIQGPITSPADDPSLLFDGFYVTGGNNLNEHGGGISIRGADAIVRNNVIFSNTGYYLGGGIYAYGGEIVLQNNHVFSNVVLPSGDEGFGGGIQIESGDVQLIDNIISSNVISANKGFGAGIDILSGRVIIVGNQVFSNSHSGEQGIADDFGSGYGGGLAVHTGASALISRTVFNGNRAREGGAIHNSGAISLTGSTLMHNYARISAGGLFNAFDATTYLGNSLLISNTAATYGDGMWNKGMITARNSIFLQANGENCDLERDGLELISLGHNLENGFTCGLKVGLGDFSQNDLSLKVTFDPENGASYTQTNVSILIDAGDKFDCPAVDANGTPRPQDGNGDGIPLCDIGPVEYVKTGADIVYAVTTAADEDDGTCAPDDCSLREAINAANAHPGLDTVRMGAFDSGAGLFIDEFLGQMNISDDLILLCEPSIPLNATSTGNRYFEIESGANVTLQDCTIQGGMATNGGGIYVKGGDLTLIDGYIAFNKASERGGGIFVEDGRLTLQNTWVNNNQSDLHGGGISLLGDSHVDIVDGSLIERNSSDLGGGVLSDVGGRLMIRNSTVSSNTANSGGGIYSAGQTDLIDTVVEKNVAASSGGGVYIQQGSVQMFGGTWVRNNRAKFGGGVYLSAETGTLTLKQSTISGNEALVGGGLVLRAEAAIENSSIYSNQAIAEEGEVGSGRGGGIYVSVSDLTLVHTTIAFNQGSGLYMLGDDGDDGKGGLGPATFANIEVGNSIIALNRSSAKEFEAADCTFGNNEINFIQTGPNLSEANTCPDFEEGDAAFDFSGGRDSAKIDSGYLSLLERSDAIDAADDGLCDLVGNVDQRNGGRPHGPKCDLGAYEFGATPIPPTNEMPKIFLPLILVP
ncbi:MAG: right-handed parallel beta-helix repeat-containing protein [Anaerolineae bacterium]